MAAIDSILGIMVQLGANELRLGTDRAPTMFASGVQKRLSIDETSEETLRLLLGPILSADRENSLRAGGKVECPYESAEFGSFHVILAPRPDLGQSSTGACPFELDVVFLRGTSRSALTPLPGPQPAHRPAPLPTPMHESVTVDEQEPPSSVRPAPTPPILNQSLAALLSLASGQRASDLHLCTGEAPSIRVDGRLRRLSDTPIRSVDALLEGLLPSDLTPHTAGGRGIDFAAVVPDLGRIRVNTYEAQSRSCAAIRLLSSTPPTLAELGLPVALDDMADLPHGLVLVCGPTGCGKSSTLAALAQNILKRRPVLLLSLEDPIEYVFQAQLNGSLVRQRQVGIDVTDFPTGLRDALREDPDVILVGEMRDPESISLALTAAETGHLVLSSIHSRSAASAIERIVDSYPPGRQQQIRVQLADALRAVISQRLIPRARGGGRAVGMEVLRVNHSVANLIREGRTAQISTVLQAGRKDGMLPLERSLADLVRSGQVSLPEARAVANDLGSLDNYLQDRVPG